MLGYPRLKRTRKRSSWASGSGKVPSWSIGFCVAMTQNGGCNSCVMPSTVTRPSAIASSRRPGSAAWPG